MPLPIDPIQLDGSIRTLLLYNIQQALTSMPQIPLPPLPDLVLNSVTDQLLYNILDAISGGSGGDTYRVKVTAADTTPDFLLAKLASDSLSIALKSAGANEQVKLEQKFIEFASLAAFSAVASASGLIAGAWYKVNGVHNGLCTMYVQAISTVAIAPYCAIDYTNATMGGVKLNASAEYSYSNDTFASVYFPDKNVICGCINNPVGKAVSLLENTNWNLANVNDCNFGAYAGAIDNNSTITSVYAFFPYNDSASQPSFSAVNSQVFRTWLNGGNLSADNSQLDTCSINNGASVTAVNGSNINSCYFGVNKSASFESDSYFGKSIYDNYSSFDIVANPNAGGIIDISAKSFVGIIRPDDNTASGNISSIVTTGNDLDIEIWYNGAQFTIIDGANISHQGGNIDLDNAINKSLKVHLTKHPATGSKLFVAWHTVQN